MASPPSLDLATKTYHQAVQLFKTKYTKDDAKRRWLDSVNSLEDVQQAVVDAQLEYTTRSYSQTKTHLNKFSAGVMHYSSVMDVLAQHHPEYVSLAWGTLKLVFVMVTNHEELVKELAEAFSRIADALPRMELQLYLYPTNVMKAAVEELYALVIRFFQRALRWYKASTLKHVLHSLIKPYKLEFEDVANAIAARARSIDALAVSLAHREIRDMYLIVKELLNDTKSNQRSWGTLQTTLKDSEEREEKTIQMLREVQETLTAHQAVNEALLLNTERSTREMQTALIIASSGPEFDAPLDILRRRRLALRRHRSSMRISMNEVWSAKTIKAWARKEQSAILFVAGSLLTKLETKSITTCFVELIRSADAPVIWALKGSALSSASLPSVVKYLAMQALKLNPDHINGLISANFNAARVASATTDDDWMQVLLAAVAWLPQIYLVIDTEFLGSTADSKIEMIAWLLSWVNMLRLHSGTIVKIALTSHRRASFQAATEVQSCTEEMSLVNLKDQSQRSGRAYPRSKIALQPKKGL